VTGGPVAAIVPAAGRSARMGRPKLTLPIQGRALIARVVEALRGGGADPVIVVAPPREAPGAADLIDEAEGVGAWVVVPPGFTADMRASIVLGLGVLAGIEAVGILLAPGDSPGLTASLVARVVGRGRAEPGAIVAPTFEGRRGHPVWLPADLAAAIERLPAGVGVNALLAANEDRIVAVEADDAGALADLDTPDDYRRWASA
jgi:molybdenum cofactor cytidylyltransferase